MKGFNMFVFLFTRYDFENKPIQRSWRFQGQLLPSKSMITEVIQWIDDYGWVHETIHYSDESAEVHADMCNGSIPEPKTQEGFLKAVLDMFGDYSPKHVRDMQHVWKPEIVLAEDCVEDAERRLYFNIGDCGFGASDSPVSISEASWDKARETFKQAIACRVRWAEWKEM